MEYLRKKAYTHVKHVEDGVTTVKAKLSGYISPEGIDATYGYKGLRWTVTITIDQALKDKLIKEVKHKQ